MKSTNQISIFTNKAPQTSFTTSLLMVKKKDISESEELPQLKDGKVSLTTTEIPIAARAKGPGPAAYTLPPTIGPQAKTKGIRAPAYSFGTKLNANRDGIIIIIQKILLVQTNSFLRLLEQAYLKDLHFHYKVVLKRVVFID